jgi:hypothetical protein
LISTAYSSLLVPHADPRWGRRKEAGREERRRGISSPPQQWLSEVADLQGVEGEGWDVGVQSGEVGFQMERGRVDLQGGDGSGGDGDKAGGGEITGVPSNEYLVHVEIHGYFSQFMQEFSLCSADGLAGHPRGFNFFKVLQVQRG